MSIRNSFGLDFSFSENEIYLDSATLGKVPISSLEIMNHFYSEFGGGTNRGTNKRAINANRLLEQSRTTIADIFSISSNNIAFLPSRETAIINLLFSGIFTKKDEIIISTLDDHSILAPTYKLRTLNDVQLNFLNLEEELNLKNSIYEKITEKTKAVILSSLTLGIGAKRNWKEITQITQDAGVMFILDISNNIGHEDFNFGSISPDIIISSGSIGALGPQGTAFQIIKDDIVKQFDPILVGGGTIISLNRHSYTLSSNISKYEPGTLNISGIIGLANSLKLLSEIGFDKISRHDLELRKLLEKGLQKTNKIQILEQKGLDSGPIISFFSDEIDSHDIAIILEDLGDVYVRSGALCSHLLMEEIKRNSLVQISTHLYNSKDDITNFLELLNSIMSEI